MSESSALFSAASDPLIWQQHPESDRYTRRVFQRYFDGAMESRGAFASRGASESLRFLQPPITSIAMRAIAWTFIGLAFDV